MHQALMLLAIFRHMWNTSFTHFHGMLYFHPVKVPNTEV